MGDHPETGEPIIARMGKYGPMVQVGRTDNEEKKPRYAKLLPEQSITTITLEEALELFKLPRVLGENEDGKVIKASIGRFGPYVQLDRTFASIPKDADFTAYNVTLAQAVELIKEKQEKDKNKFIQVFEEEDIQVLNGRYGPYIKQGRKNYKIPKDKEPKDLTLEEIQEIIKNAPAKKGRGRKK